jgi:hypothetical protein
MKNITVDMTSDDLLVIIGALIKLQMATGVKDERLLDLSARLSTIAIDKLSEDDFEYSINKLDKK